MNINALFLEIFKQAGGGCLRSQRRCTALLKISNKSGLYTVKKNSLSLVLVQSVPTKKICKRGASALRRIIQ